MLCPEVMLMQMAASLLQERAFALLPTLALDLLTFALMLCLEVMLMQMAASPLQESAFARPPTLVSGLLMSVLQIRPELASMLPVCTLPPRLLLLQP